MLKVLWLQAGAVLLATLLAGLLAGRSGALSALAGGAAYFLPNLLFVLRLARGAGAVGFIVGEAVKLTGVVALLVVLPHLIEVNWPALIAGLIAVLFVNLFALLLKA